MDKAFMEEAIALAVENVKQHGGGPFGALVVHEGEVIARGTNRVTVASDPTAHAEMVAIRAACARLGHFQLGGCHLYTSCEPCPMCLGAIYWARLERVFYAATKEDAAAAGFDDTYIYRELALPLDERRIPMTPLMRSAAQRAFDAWRAQSDRAAY